MTWLGHRGVDEAVRSMAPWLLPIICVTCWSSGGADDPVMTAPALL